MQAEDLDKVIEKNFNDAQFFAHNAYFLTLLKEI